MAGQPACWARWTNASPIDHRRVGYSWKEMGAPRAEVAASIVGGKYLQVVGAPRRLGDRHLSVRMQGPVAAGRRDDDRAVVGEAEDLAAHVDAADVDEAARPELEAEEALPVAAQRGFLVDSGRQYPKCAGATLFFITGSNSNTSRARRGSVSRAASRARLEGGPAGLGGEAGSWASPRAAPSTKRGLAARNLRKRRRSMLPRAREGLIGSIASEIGAVGKCSATARRKQRPRASPGRRRCAARQEAAA